MLLAKRQLVLVTHKHWFHRGHEAELNAQGLPHSWDTPPINIILAHTFPPQSTSDNIFEVVWCLKGRVRIGVYCIQTGRERRGGEEGWDWWGHQRHDYAIARSLLCRHQPACVGADIRMPVRNATKNGRRDCHIPYSEKFWIGANFWIFHMMARHTKIHTTKSFAFKLLIMSNFKCGQSPTWYGDRAMALYQYFQPSGAGTVPDPSGPLSAHVRMVFPVLLELNTWRTVWNLSRSKQWSHLSVGRESIWTRSSSEHGLWQYRLSLQPQR